MPRKGTKEQIQEANRKYHREYYKRPDRQAYVQKKMRERHTKIKKWFSDLRSTMKCIQCGEDHPACLDFHHRDPKTKVRAVAQMVADAFSKTNILKERAADNCQTLVRVPGSSFPERDK